MALAIDGTATNTMSGGSSFTLTLTTTNAQDIIIVAVHQESTGTTQSVSNVTATGLTFAKRAATQFASGGNADLEYWWAYASAALTSAVITVTLSGSIDDAAGYAFGVTGFTGTAYQTAPWDTNASLGQASSKTNANATPVTNTFSTTAANTMLLVVYGSTESGGASADSPLTTGTGCPVSNTGGTNFSNVTVGFQVVSATQTNITRSLGGGAGLTGWILFADALSQTGGAAAVALVAPLLYSPLRLIKGPVGPFNPTITPAAFLSQVTTAALLASGLATLMGRAGPSGSTALAAQGTAESSGKLTFAGKAALAAAGKSQATGSFGPFTGKAALLAQGLAALFGRINFAGTTSLSAKGTAASFGKGTIGFFAFLQGRGAAMAKGALQFSGAAGLAAKGAAMAKGTLQFAGTTGLAATGAAASFGKGTIGFFAFLQGRGAAMAKGAAQIAGTAGLTAKGAAAAKGALQFAGTTALAAQGVAASFGKLVPPGAIALIATGAARAMGKILFSGVVPLSGRGEAKAKGNATEGTGSGTGTQHHDNPFLAWIGSLMGID